MSWFVVTSWWSRNDLGCWDAMSFWDWYAFWYFNSSWYLDWNISAFALNLNTACWWSNSYWGWSNDRSSGNWSWPNWYSSKMRSIRIWGTFSNNVSSCGCSKSSWCWEAYMSNSGWCSKCSWCWDAYRSYSGWCSDSSDYSWGSNLVSDNLSMLLNTNKLDVLSYSGFLAYLY